MRSSPSEPDLCVIGASEAGRTAAMAAVALGLSVTLIDDGRDADSLSNPDVLLEALRVLSLRHRQAQGSSPSSCQDAEALTMHINAAASAAAADRRLDRLGAMNIRILRATGHFVDEKTIMADDHTLRAWRTIIATGADKSAISDTHLARGRCFTIATLHRLSAIPQHLIVLGGTGDALAAAQCFARLGSTVTIVADALAPDFDPELAAPVLRSLKRDGIQFAKGDVDVIEADALGLAIHLQGGTRIAASHLLLAKEGQPALGALDLARAKIRCVGEGLYLTPSLRTTNTHVYAVGRAAGASSTQMGVGQASVALRAAFFRLPLQFKPESTASVTLTDPEIASVGLTEQGAKARGPVAIWRWPLAETAMGFARGEPHGHVKIIADRRGRILGAGLVGRAVRDLVPFWSLAIDQQLSLGDLAHVSIPSPSFSEASRRLVLSHAAGRLGNPWLKRALAVSRWFG